MKVIPIVEVPRTYLCSWVQTNSKTIFEFLEWVADNYEGVERFGNGFQALTSEPVNIGKAYKSYMLHPPETMVGYCKYIVTFKDDVGVMKFRLRWAG